MKKITKYFSLFFAALLMIPVFGVSLSAKTFTIDLFYNGAPWVNIEW